MRRLTALAQPFLLGLDPERAHGLAIESLKRGLYPRAEGARAPELRTTAFGLSFANPLGMAAGFDKNGAVPDALLDLGFGHTEVGSVTPLPQAGNPQPRVFRLIEHKAVINRLGFNNDGHEVVHRRLAQRRRTGILGINVGANKDAADRVADYAAGIRRFADLADYVTINVSSPNTPGLRDLQGGEDLDRLLGEAVAARTESVEAIRAGKPLPLLLKVAPDLSDAQCAAIAKAVMVHGIDGLIVSNTTLSRALVAGHSRAGEAGGLSGAPLFRRSTIMLARFARLTEGQIPLIGVGGITSGAEAWTKIAAGATLVQLYTGLIYGGFGLVEDILSTLRHSARRAGYARVQDAVGSNVDAWTDQSLED